MHKDYRNEKGEYHREDGPAYICPTYQAWYQNNKRHRKDGPAIIDSSNGYQAWYQNGKLHREDGPAIIFPNTSTFWYQNGKKHRENGPAVIRSNGYKAWYQNGKLHRGDGPAVIKSDGIKYWSFNDREVTEEWINKYQKLIKKHTLLGIPVRDKWRVREIILSWYYNPKLGCVKNRIERKYEELFL